MDLQRRHGLPHASPERELEYAARLTEELLACASEVILSYPRYEGERELRPSPLIIQIEEVPHRALSFTAVPDYRTLIYSSRQLEPLADIPIPSLPEGEQMQGGTGVFKDQAACPFRAFARYRLGARRLETAAVGLDAAARGTLVHQALKLVWETLRNHERLCAASDPELEEIIDRSVMLALRSAMSQRPEFFTVRFRALEAARLKDLIQSWLAFERARPSFEILELEATRSIAVGGLKIKVTVDRIDRLLDGRKVVIDYKTGDPKRVTVSAWFSERPDDPQLPLYAAYAEGDIAAVLFSLIRRGQHGWEGLAGEDDIIPTIKSFRENTETEVGGDWQALFENWRVVLEGLALAFRTGDPRVDPRYPPTTCRYCDLGPLCRIQGSSSMQGG
jgi:probable DNA repair protein